MSHSELSRKYGIHPMTIYKWKRQMTDNKKNSDSLNIDLSNINELLQEIEKLKKENDHLKRAVGDLAIDKQILQVANDIYKKKQMEEMFKLPKKLSESLKKNSSIF